eukprot:Tamp_15427.p3 GENE.Tamp_15427~~Tamp_15427.p3  ORF type:complete len:168 (-),score=33.24 Tamp_15427:795-1298(-)
MVIQAANQPLGVDVLGGHCVGGVATEGGASATVGKTAVAASARRGERHRQPSPKAAADAPERTVGAKHKAGGDVTAVVGRKAKKAKKGPKTLKAKKDPKTLKAKKGPKTLKKPEPQCQHGRRKRQCKECGTGQCQHGRFKHQCKVVSRVHDVPDACALPTVYCAVPS